MLQALPSVSHSLVLPLSEAQRAHAHSRYLQQPLAALLALCVHERDTWLRNTSCTATDPGPGNILDLKYNFNLGASDNGNVIGITNNRDTTRTQSFTYDQVNRIVTAQTSATTGTNCWGETYTMDQWANMTAIGALSGYTGCTQETLGVSATTSNQLSATGFTFDSSGNMLTDGLNTYGWNAESEIKSAAGVNYTYDGDGNRLQKSNGKIYWYGAGTEILDESDASGNFTNEYVFFGGKRIAMRNVSSGTIYYYAEDVLGSSRTLVQAGQTSVCYDADFYPFGGERDIVTTCSQNYKFEGKERDTETNNDDFGARYYSSRFGRWLSADWSAVPAPVPYANLTNPQTLNLYAMVRDNPETFADLDGHVETIPRNLHEKGLVVVSMTDSRTLIPQAMTAAETRIPRPRMPKLPNRKRRLRTASRLPPIRTARLKRHRRRTIKATR